MGNFIVTITGDTANYGFIAENLWNGKLWTGRFATYTDDWNLTEYVQSSNLNTKLDSEKYYFGTYIGPGSQGINYFHIEIPDRPGNWTATAINGNPNANPIAVVGCQYVDHTILRINLGNAPSGTFQVNYAVFWT